MYLSKEELAKEYDISVEEVEKVLQFVSERTQEILSGDWQKDENCQRPDNKEIRNAKSTFQEAMGVLFLTNYEQYPKNHVKAIGNLVTEAFKPGSVTTPKESYYQHYDAEYITFCIGEYLTDKERRIICLRYGMMDGIKRSYEKTAKIDHHTYSRQWVRSIAQKAERKLLARYYQKEAEQRKA